MYLYLCLSTPVRPETWKKFCVNHNMNEGFDRYTLKSIIYTIILEVFPPMVITINDISFSRDDYAARIIMQVHQSNPMRLLYVWNNYSFFQLPPSL